MTHDENKLPVWAQRLISQLRAEIDAMQREVAEAMALNGLQPAEATLSVVAPSRKRIFWDAECDGISVIYDKGVLEVVSSWGRGLSVEPVVSNVIKVTSR